jgi:hypothetical protein
MKSIVTFICFIYTQVAFSQCDCEKIRREDGVVTQCNPRPIAGDDNLQIGIALASNGEKKFLTLTIRYLSGPALKISGDINVRSYNNNLSTYNLINAQSSYVGNSKVENGLFLINETQFNNLKYAKLMTISVKLSDDRIHTYEVTLNPNVLMEQARCL